MNEQQTVAPFISLDAAVLRIHQKWQRVVDTQQKAHSARVECGMELLALRARIEAGEAGEVSWWNWYQQKFTRDRRDAERIMAIASAENPQTAHEAEKAATRQRMQALRASRTGAQTQCAPDSAPTHREREQDNPSDEQQELLPPDPSQQYLIDQIIDLFKALHRQSQIRCAVKLRNIMRGQA
jgi:hypothetical protein